jgi:hypothetical protein
MLIPERLSRVPFLGYAENDGSRGLFTQRIALNRSAPIHHDAVMLAEIGGNDGSKSRSIRLEIDRVPTIDTCKVASIGMSQPVVAALR